MRPSSSTTPSRSSLVSTSASQSSTIRSRGSSTLQTTRSSSSLTSKEAEFQAWKRRKDYNPLKSASSKNKETRKSSSSSSRGNLVSNATKERSSPRTRKQGNRQAAAREET